MTSSGDGQDYDDDGFGKQSNVIPLRPQKKKAEPPPKPGPAHEPLINLPPYTKYLIAIILSIHVVVTLLLTAEQAHWVYINLGFIPGRFSGAAIFQPLALLTPLTHLFLHGGWLHIGMNTVMLLAFGSGVERWLGGQKMIFLFITSGLFGAATHFALNYDSISPVIGASGGLSGLFAAALIMINRYNDGMTGKYGMWPFVILWIGLSIVMGMMGSPDGSQIAWAAHVGGFLGGFIMLKLMKV